MLVTLAGFANSLHTLMETLKAHPSITIDNIIRFADRLESHNAFSDAAMQDACMRCSADTCQREGVLGCKLSSNPIPDAIKNTHKCLGYDFEEPATVRCDQCGATSSGYAAIERAALVELSKHEDMAPLVKAWRQQDKNAIRELAVLPEAELDMDKLNSPKCQAILALVVLQANCHRAGHHKSCFKVKAIATCRYRFPRECHDNKVTRLLLNGVTFIDSSNDMQQHEEEDEEVPIIFFLLGISVNMFG